MIDYAHTTAANSAYGFFGAWGTGTAESFLHQHLARRRIRDFQDTRVLGRHPLISQTAHDTPSLCILDFQLKVSSFQPRIVVTPHRSKTFLQFPPVPFSSLWVPQRYSKSCEPGYPQDSLCWLPDLLALTSVVETPRGVLKTASRITVDFRTQKRAKVKQRSHVSQIFVYLSFDHGNQSHIPCMKN